MDRIAARLRALRNPDGGWGTTARRPSNTEATALASLALEPGAAREGALHWLRTRQRPDGSWPWTDEIDSPSWASAQAVLALAHDGREPVRTAVGATWLLACESRGLGWRHRLAGLLGRQRDNELDASLTGWPWTADTFAWIEPTAFALLALKTALPGVRSRRAAERIREAEAMILDRECPGGGWNYGNKRVLGADQRPYPDTTALALLALQGVRHGDAARRGLAVLDRLADEASSGLALALAALCRGARGLDSAALRGRLAGRFERTGFMDESRVLALALLALRDPAALRLHADA